MALLGAALLSLRRDPRIQKLWPFLSALSILVGITWLFLLPLDGYSRQTYVSENALLPGQVHTYFSGSEQNIFRAFRQEVEDLWQSNDTSFAPKIRKIFTESGLKVASQKYKYHSAGNVYAGENVYALIRAPRGDGTEAIVIIAPWISPDGLPNKHGVALVLTLARYFQRWSLWSKDIIFLVTADSRAGSQAWVDAYHNMHDPSKIASLPLKSGALQGAMVVDYSLDHRFESLHILYDGVNGQLPNLDLFNTAVAIASGQMGIGISLQRMWHHDDSYEHRLQTMVRGMLSQGLGHASGPHSSFVPYHIDAITLQATGDGWQDEMAFGRSIEGLTRSLNNLLEHFHQSFFFYLLMQANRFVSIGTYLPSAMLVAVNFTIMAIALWVKSGSPELQKITSKSTSTAPIEKVEMKAIEFGGATAVVPQEMVTVLERKLSLPLTCVLGSHLLGMFPLVLFNHTSSDNLGLAASFFAFYQTILPMGLAILIHKRFTPSPQQYMLMKSFSLLLLGMFLSSLATVNFSLSFIIGVVSTPLTFIPLPPASKVVAIVFILLLSMVSPFGILNISSVYWGIPIARILEEAAFGWDVWGMWTPIVVWCIWWPAWLIGSVLLNCSIVDSTTTMGMKKVRRP
ncbi:MAG: Glycosyl phosphatidyl inositol protein transamidase complex subunit [Cirrosporium novae-zelandiae]|nr:MAG: Glycosyl phosphatidyl inositol protein transamidase complex subunit [Cirrosporium novae-zelandiae]